MNTQRDITCWCWLQTEQKNTRSVAFIFCHSQQRYSTRLMTKYRVDQTLPIFPVLGNLDRSTSIWYTSDGVHGGKPMLHIGKFWCSHIVRNTSHAGSGIERSKLESPNQQVVIFCSKTVPHLAPIAFSVDLEESISHDWHDHNHPHNNETI
jgi:hypothetical protein